MKIALIGNEKRFKVIQNIIDEYFPELHTIYICINIDNDLKSYEKSIRDAEGQVDAFLFTGQIIYNIVSDKIAFNLPVFYIPRDNNPFLIALIQSLLIEKKQEYIFTVDYYSQSTIDEILSEILSVGSQLPIKIINCPFNVNRTEDVQNVINFHMHHYHNSNISCCITGLSSVEHFLKSQGIKALRLNPSNYIIRHTINNFLLSLQLKDDNKNLSACVYVEIDRISKFSQLNLNEYDFMLQKMLVSKEVYLFSDRVRGAVVENGNNGYYIFSSKELVELATDQYKHISLIDNLYKNIEFTLSVGIGYGQTVRDAKINSLECIQKAISNGGNKAYFKIKNKILGPYISSELDDNNYMIDKRIYKITDISGLSNSTILKLTQIIAQQGTNQFTSSELAALMNLTPRTVNRIITKLMDSGFARIAGRKIINTTGRPSRIIELML